MAGPLAVRGRSPPIDLYGRGRLAGSGDARARRGRDRDHAPLEPGLGEPPGRDGGRLRTRPHLHRAGPERGSLRHAPRPVVGARSVRCRLGEVPDERHPRRPAVLGEGAVPARGSGRTAGSCRQWPVRQPWLPLDPAVRPARLVVARPPGDHRRQPERPVRRRAAHPADRRLAGRRHTGQPVRRPARPRPRPDGAWCSPRWPTPTAATNTPTSASTTTAASPSSADACRPCTPGPNQPKENHHDHRTRRVPPRPCCPTCR